MASAKEFIQSPSLEVLETFKKDMLMQIAIELQLEVKRSTHKHELKRLIVEQLVDEDILPDSCLDVYKPLPMEPSGQLEIWRLEIERELRLKELEAQLRLNSEKKSLKLNNENRSSKLNSEKNSLRLNKEKRSSKFKSEKKSLKLKNMKKNLSLNMKEK